MNFVFFKNLLGNSRPAAAAAAAAATAYAIAVRPNPTAAAAATAEDAAASASSYTAASCSPLRVCVFGSSSARTRPDYLAEARGLGALLAARGHVCLNGAGRFGGMGALNEGCLAGGGRVEGVIHRMWLPSGGKDELQHGLTELKVASGPTLAERKKLLCEDADCFIILPGGPGTYDEMWEVISERQLSLPKGKVPRPVVLVNIDGYWDASMAQLQRCHDDGMLYKRPDEVVRVETSGEAALDFVEAEVARLRAASGGREAAGGVALQTDEARQKSKL